MPIERVPNKYRKTDKDPLEVVANTEMDALRRKECLCVNCDRKNDKPMYSSCPAAAAIYKACVDHNMAMMITRCGAVDDKGELLYKPLK